MTNFVTNLDVIVTYLDTNSLLLEKKSGLDPNVPNKKMYVFPYLQARGFAVAINEVPDHHDNALLTVKVKNITTKNAKTDFVVSKEIKYFYKGTALNNTYMYMLHIDILECIKLGKGVYRVYFTLTTKNNIYVFNCLDIYNK